MHESRAYHDRRMRYLIRIGGVDSKGPLPRLVHGDSRLTKSGNVREAKLAPEKWYTGAQHSYAFIPFAMSVAADVMFKFTPRDQLFHSLRVSVGI